MDAREEKEYLETLKEIEQYRSSMKLERAGMSLLMLLNRYNILYKALENDEMEYNFHAVMRSWLTWARRKS